MTEKRYLVEYEIESHGILDSIDSVTFCHPKRDVTIELRHKSVEPGQYFAVLSAYLVFEAKSLEEAQNNSDEILTEFIDMLTFITNMNFRIGDKLRIVDWTLGIEERECLILNKFPGDERPYPVINQPLLDSIQLLLSGNMPAELRRSLKWFSSGVSARFMDEQFQCFWFVVEILAQVVKPTTKVNDICPTCKEPLYCHKCEKSPTHRPYPKQSIAYLFSKVVRGDEGKAFEVCDQVRNSLMHGDDIDLIELETNTEFSKHIDLIGKVAWHALLHVLKSSLPATEETHQLNYLETKTYCKYVMHLATHVTFKSGKSNSPQIEELPKFNVEMVYR